MDWNIQLCSNGKPDTQLIYQVIYFLFSKGAILEANDDFMNLSESHGFDTSIQSLPLDFSQFNAERLCGCLRSDILEKTKYGITRSGYIVGNMCLQGETDFHFKIYLGTREGVCYIEICNKNTGTIEEKMFMAFIELCKELFVRLDFLYGAFKPSGVIPFSDEKILEEQPEFFSLYSKPLVDRIGREKLLSTPALKTEELENGGVMLFLPGDRAVNLDHYRQILRNLQENIDVLIQSSDPWIWHFSVPGKAKTIADVNVEFLEMTKKLLEIIEGFFIPTKIFIGLKTYTQKALDNQRFEISEILSSGAHTKIESEKVVTYQDILQGLNEIETPKDLFKHISRIAMEGKVKVTLRGKEQYIDQNSPNDIYSLSLDPWVGPTWGEPFKIEIDTFQYDKLDTFPLTYDIEFSSYTNIWFDTTEIGKANDHRLKTVIKKLHDNFEIESEESYLS